MYFIITKGDCRLGGQLCNIWGAHGQTHIDNAFQCGTDPRAFSDGHWKYPRTCGKPCGDTSDNNLIVCHRRRCMGMSLSETCLGKLGTWHCNDEHDQSTLRVLSIPYRQSVFLPTSRKQQTGQDKISLVFFGIMTLPRAEVGRYACQCHQARSWTRGCNWRVFIYSHWMSLGQFQQQNC